MSTPEFDLSVIIPVINEQDHIATLLDQLSHQAHIELQIIIANGGSSDNTLALCLDFEEQNDIILHIINTTPGRAVQMNGGVDIALATELLFLHADTQIDDVQLLRKGLEYKKLVSKTLNTDNLAGHFPIIFSDTQNQHPQGFFFYAAKSSLNRPDCINGDQGLLISKSYFTELGKFDESLPYMEDARISTRIFETGQWITLPSHVNTSARRFITEGLKERQLLNSFLCNFQSIGMNRFFSFARKAYQEQNKAERLRIKPFLVIIHRLMKKDGIMPALKWWYKTGGYIAGNAWQLAFAIDCSRHWRSFDSPSAVKPKTLQFFDKYLAPTFNTGIIKAITAILTFIWFYSLWIVYR